MAATKRLTTSYLITTPTTAGSNITLTTSNVFINGNLVVAGVTTTVNTTDTAIKDNTIVLNNGELGNGVTLSSSGINVYRGPYTGVYKSTGIRWYEPFLCWQLTNDGTNWANIVSSGTGVGLVLNHIVQDTDPLLGANLNTNGFTLFANVGRNIILDGNVQMNYVTSIPPLTSGSSTMYSRAPGGGQSAVYVTNSASTDEELITKRRAVGLSILL
jgi:hypothetical protein